MTQDEKAKAYDEYVRLADILLSENSRLKSLNPVKMSEQTTKIIEENNNKLRELEMKVKNLFV
jgi:hypothetical protein|tara:strand:- start:5865 stop:6053 length:189 start_codon:yes stop_codon:yes gene_type:complete